MIGMGSFGGLPENVWLPDVSRAAQKIRHRRGIAAIDKGEHLLDAGIYRELLAEIKTRDCRNCR